MKKFELKAFIGKSLVYRSIFSFTPEQERIYLEEILTEKNYGRQMMDAEFESTTALFIGLKKFEREFSEKWSRMSLEEYVKNYPDIAIATALASCMYEIGWPNSDDVQFGLPKTIIHEEFTNRLDSYSWKCKRIE